MKRCNDNHFEDLDYDAELPSHVMGYFADVKCRKIFDAIWNCKNIALTNPVPALGLDLGCGTGHHVGWLFNQFNFMSLNANTIGLDLSMGNINHAKKSYPWCNFGRADITDLSDFASNFLHYAYTINVLHHMGKTEDQLRVMRGVHRILRPGGIFVIAEMNFLNPLIALYVKHLFRYVRNIDQGSEVWFDPKLLKGTAFKLIKKEYFTFTPDFCPKWLLPLFRRIDAWADGRWFSRFGAHVMYVLEKV